MKRALYYSLRHGFYRGLGYRPVAVTTVKGDHWYGRDLEHENATHGNMRDLTGNFATITECMAKIAGLQALELRFEPKHEAVRKAVRALEAEHREAIAAYLKESK